MFITAVPLMKKDYIEGCPAVCLMCVMAKWFVRDAVEPPNF